jgi:hypothetical protein
MKPENRRRLKAFVRRSQRIRNYKYFDGGEDVVGFEINKVESGFAMKFHQPNREETDALALNLKVFVQRKDDISIENMAKLCDDPGISDEWKAEFKEIRGNLNARLNQVYAKGPPGTLTYNELFRMILFGVISHEEETHPDRIKFKQWVVDKNAWAMDYNTFHEVVMLVSLAVINIGVACREELARSPLDKQP